MQVFTAFNARRQQRGLTLIEACIGLAVIGILTATAAPQLNDTLELRVLEGAAAELATDLQYIRTEAVSRREGVRWTLKAVPGGSCAVIHTGPVNACECAADGAAQCNAPAQLIKSTVHPASKGLTVAASVASIRIEPTHGMTTPAGTIRLIRSDGRELHHVVNIMGRTRTCSPGGEVRGYKPC
jgi:type IV fimbrial biogenesis protein FimT